MESMNLEKISVILLDVAGTTTAINFVEGTLYPYVLKNVEEFLKDNWDDENVKKAVSEFEEKDLDAAKTAELVKNLTEKNDSNVGVKSIQGLLYKKGYETGELKAHIFPDVPKCLESWHKMKKIAIFSTGSIESQELLFKNTTEGDFTKYISKYFDQAFGVKTESETYKKIAEELEVPTQNILFITDNLKEAEAAKSVEVSTLLIKREGNSELPENSGFTIINSFDEITFETIKRKIEEENTEEPPMKIAKTDVKETTEEAMEVTPQTEEGIKESKVETEAIITEKTETSVEKTEPETSTEKTSSEDKTEISVDKTEAETVVSSTEKPETVEVVDAKMETNIGTQTKTDTNECEVQTTISIKADKEIPVEEVHEKLTTKSIEEETNGVEEKENKSELANGNNKSEEKDEKVETTGEDVQKKKIDEPIETSPVSVKA